MPAKKKKAGWISPLGQSVAEARAKRMRNPEYRAAVEARAKKKGDDLDRSIAQRTAKNKNFPALVADAQKRAEQFNAAERIAELETELAAVKAAAAQLAEYLGTSDLDAIARIARLRAALEEIRDLDIDLDHETFVRESSRIAMLALASESSARRRGSSSKR
jgi:hypothetical protein